MEIILNTKIDVRNSRIISENKIIKLAQKLRTGRTLTNLESKQTIDTFYTEKNLINLLQTKIFSMYRIWLPPHNYDFTIYSDSQLDANLWLRSSFKNFNNVNLILRFLGIDNYKKDNDNYNLNEWLKDAEFSVVYFFNTKIKELLYKIDLCYIKRPFSFLCDILDLNKKILTNSKLSFEDIITFAELLLEIKIKISTRTIPNQNHWNSAFDKIWLFKDLLIKF